MLIQAKYNFTWTKSDLKYTSDDLIDMFDIHLSPSVFSQPKAAYSASRLHF